MPHITNIDERCLIFISQNVIRYSRAAEFHFQTTPLNLHRREVFQFGLREHDSFTNVNVIIALTREFSLAAQFSICVREIQSSILGMPNFIGFHERCWSYACQREPVLRISPFQCARQEVFEFRCRTWAFGLVEWLSVWVRQVPSSILGMTHFTNLNEMCWVPLSKRYWLKSLI